MQNYSLIVTLSLLVCAVFLGGESVKECDVAKSNPQLSPLLCNWDMEKAGLARYVCPRLVDNSNSAQHLQTTKERWKKKFSDFSKGIEGKNVAITMVGDSLTGIMGHQWRCLEDLVGISGSVLKALLSDPYLAKLPRKCKPEQGRINSLKPLGHWYDDVKAATREGEKEYIVLNTGAWWDDINLHALNNSKKKLGPREVVKAYSAHFDTKSRLMFFIRSLQHDYNKTIVWRETAPAGICAKKDPFSSHSFFSRYNDIARNALIKENVLMLNIWNETLIYHDQYTSEGDVLHYCLFQSQSAPNIWIEKLFDLILRNEQ